MGVCGYLAGSVGLSAVACSAWLRSRILTQVIAPLFWIFTFTCSPLRKTLKPRNIVVAADSLPLRNFLLITLRASHKSPRNTKSERIASTCWDISDWLRKAATVWRVIPKSSAICDLVAPRLALVIIACCTSGDFLDLRFLGAGTGSNCAGGLFALIGHTIRMDSRAGMLAGLAHPFADSVTYRLLSAPVFAGSNSNACHHLAHHKLIDARTVYP